MWVNRRCLRQEPVSPVTVFTYDAVRVVEERLTRWPRISLRRLSEEICLRQGFIEQPTEEITAVLFQTIHRLQSRSLPAKVQVLPLV